jgi:hypothetical protein
MGLRLSFVTIIVFMFAAAAFLASLHFLNV